MHSTSFSKSCLLSCFCNSSETVTTIDVESIHSPETSEQSITSLPQYIINFGTVNIGSKAKQIVRLENLMVKNSLYTLIKDPNSNPIYQAFDFSNTDYPASKSKILEQFVTFHPKVPNEKYLDHFYLMQDNAYIVTILLKGECRGPRVQLSATSICFTQRGELQAVEIINVSEMPLTYQFDVNGTNYDIFQVNHPYGTLESKQGKIISISFHPKKPGVYSKYLSCLVLYEEPKIIKLSGVYANHTSQIKELKYYPRDLSEESGFAGFMLDSLMLLKNTPPFSLSQNFLDFGMVDVGSNKTNHKILVTSLTNHMSCSITVIWTNHDIFKISPKKIQIPSDESVLYEIAFMPNGSESIFYIDLIGTVHWSDDKMDPACTLVPQNISLRLLGNSFYDNNSWIPQLEMKPEAIIFPCCVPAFPSYASFILKATGYLPVSFKFIPPNRSNFIIKPMVGIVSCHQIIYAQFHPLNTQSKGYVERWEIELNGRNEGYGLPFFMKGYCEYPVIMVGNNNVIHFSTMLPGAREQENVLLKNMSAHFLQYQFMLNPDESSHAHLNITNKEGDLAANETIVINWFCIGNLNMPRVVKIPYALRFLQSSCKVMGTEFTGDVIVHASCAETNLCSVPNSMEFGDIQFDCKETTMFKLYNFGESALHFLLSNDGERDTVDIFPMQGTIKPNDSMIINVILTAVHIGKKKIDVYYSLRDFEDSIELLTPIKYKIFEISYESKLSYIQIADIEYHDYGMLFNRVSLWNIMNIENLNIILLTTVANETKDIDIYLPEYKEINQKHKIYFLLKNVSQFDTNVSIVRKQRCNCKRVERKIGISFGKLEYDCIHREMIHIEIENNYLNANCCTTMSVTCRYTTPGKNTLCFIIKLSNNREINLNIHIRTIGPSENVLSIYERNSELNLRDTYIGELNSFLHTYWVYNNTGRIIQYYLDLSELNDLQYKNNFPIIECRNPFGYIRSFTAHPLIFKFSPLEAVTYRASIPIIANQENVLILRVSGKGLMQSKGLDIKVRHPFQKSNIHHPIVVSVEHISSPPIGVWSEIHYVFFLKNFSNDVTYYYSWQNCGIAGLVEIEYDRRKGVIRPKETHSIRIIVNSLQHACITTIQMCCKLISQNAYIDHKRSEVEHRLMQEKIDGEFVITEQGEHQAENTVVIKPMPKEDFINVSLDAYIVSIADRDQYTTGKYQLEKFPDSFARMNAMRATRLIQAKGNISRGSSRKLEKLVKQQGDMNETLDMIQTVLQMIAADTVYSKQFDYILSELKATFPPYHYQVKIIDDDAQQKNLSQQKNQDIRKKLLIRAFREPQRTLLRDVLGEIVQNSLYDVFKLGSKVSQVIDNAIVLNITQECVCPTVSKPTDEGGDQEPLRHWH